MLLKRVIIAVIFIPILIFLIIKGNFFFLALVCGVIGVGLAEFYREISQDKPYAFFRNIILGLCIPVAVYFKGENVLPFVITIIIFIVFFWEIFKLKTPRAQVDIVEMGGILYISYLFSYIVIMRQSPSMGIQLVITVLFATWVGDAGAYTVGSLYGKHRFFSLYSARKSIEGFLGAVVFSLGAMFLSRLWISLPVLHLVILGILTGCCGQMGDFFESMLKRRLNIKDFGKFLSGHGGILDRFDSLFFTVPIFFYYTKYLVGLSGLIQ